jgi:hypothetical protein
MTISELIAVLIDARVLHGDVEVVLSSDEEGNGHALVSAEYAAGHWDGMYGEFSDPEDDVGETYNAIALFPQ